MRFKIHRGTKEIGGTCVEIWTDSSRLVIDMGMPLVNPDRTPFDSREAEKRSTAELIQKNILPDIPSLYQDSSKTALLISHAHQDHYGLMNHINSSCPVYLGFATKLLIELTNTFTGKEWTVQKAHHIKTGEKFNVGNINVTPYQMDHAAFDSYAFLIEADGKSLFYSGDFRIHGRNSQLFDWFSNNFDKKVDYLLLEGSTIGRKEDFQTESELEEKFVKTFSETKGTNLVYVSGQNIDRLETIYNACKRTGKIFLIDFYVANVLRTLSKKVKHNALPFPSSQTYPEIKVYFPQFLRKRMDERGMAVKTIFPFVNEKTKLGRNKIKEIPEKLVMLIRPSVKYDLEKYLFKYSSDGCFIYSMYSGYKDKPGDTKDFLKYITDKGMQIVDIHTSGHADLAGLRKMVNVVKPKHIVPIHTFEKESYITLFSDLNVKIVNDKDEIVI